MLSRAIGASHAIVVHLGDRIEQSAETVHRRYSAADSEGRRDD